MNSQQEILDLLQRFQDGYTHRDLGMVDDFMQLFTVDAEVIGTNGVKPGVDEWYVSRASARELVAGDWEGWGDLQLDIASASVRAVGDVGWIAASATVTQKIGEENYASFLEFIKNYLNQSDASPRQKLHYILRGGNNTIYELSRGEKFVWALRFTAVVLREADGWKFAQVNFSFPTVYFPDVRLMEECS